MLSAAAVQAARREYYGLNQWPRAWADDADPSKGYWPERLFHTLPSGPPFYAAQFFGPHFVFYRVGDNLHWVCTACHTYRVSTHGQSGGQYPMVHVCGDPVAVNRKLHVPNCVALICSQCAAAWRKAGHYDWRDIGDESRVPLRCMNCSGATLHNWHNFAKNAIVPKNEDKRVAREQAWKDNKGFGRVAGLLSWEFFCNNGWDPGTPGLDLAIARSVAEGNGYTLPPFTTRKDLRRLVFMGRPDPHYPHGHPLGKDAPKLGTDKEANKAFRTWFEWKPKTKFAARIQWAARDYRPNLKAQPGMPCQVMENHPRMNFFIWPIYLPEDQWGHFQKVLQSWGADRGLPLPDTFQQAWRKPNFILDRVPEMKLAAHNLQPGDDGEVFGEWWCPKPIFPVREEEIRTGKWDGPLDHPLPGEEEKQPQVKWGA